MNHIPKGLPGELNLMLLLDDTNLKQEFDKLVQNGTMDCVKKIVAKLKDRIQYLRREIYREKRNFFHENGHYEGKRLLNIINSNMGKFRDELRKKRNRRFHRK